MNSQTKAQVDVRQIAELARLQLSDQDIGRFQGEINAILQYVNRLMEVDVSQVEATAHATPIVNVYRCDELRPTLAQETVIHNAPATIDDELFSVPLVINPAAQEGA